MITLPRSRWGRLVAAGLYLAWLFGGGAYLLYGLFTYRGTGYWWRASFLGDLMVLMLPAYLLTKLLPAESAGPSAQGVRPVSDARGENRAKALRIRRALLWIGLVSAVVALALGFVGYLRSNEPVTFAPFDLSRSLGSPPRHVELTGVAQTPFVVVQAEHIGSHTTIHTYVPLTRSDWRPSDPVAFFLEPATAVYVDERGAARFDRRTPPFPVRIRGTLFHDGLPASVRAAFEKGGLQLAPSIQLLDPRPAADVEILFVLAIPAGLLALLSLTILLLASFAGRRATPAA